MPFKNLSSSPETLASLHDWSYRIRSAQSIVVAGAGMTGVELAGELGQEYASAKLKQVTLICEGNLPFTSRFSDSFRGTAKKELEKLGVKVITETKLAALPSEQSSEVILIPKGGKQYSLQADLVIPTFGILPNTEFLPREWLDERGFVKQSVKGLRVEDRENVFVIGDAGNLEESTAKNADSQAVFLAKLMEGRVLGTSRGDEEYRPDPMVVGAVSIGRHRGAGQAGSWKLWSWLVWYMKGRYLGTDAVGEFVKGNITLMKKKW